MRTNSRPAVDCMDSMFGCSAAAADRTGIHSLTGPPARSLPGRSSACRRRRPINRDQAGRQRAGLDQVAVTSGRCLSILSIYTSAFRPYLYVRSPYRSTNARTPVTRSVLLYIPRIVPTFYILHCPRTITGACKFP